MKIRRITAVLAAAAAILIASVFPVSAQAVQDAGIRVIVGEKTVTFPDQKPVIKNDRTLVPIRFIAEALGYPVEWEPKDNTAVIDHGRIILYIGTDRAVIDGKKTVLDVSSEVIKERTMVPLRVIAETLGCTVDYFSENRTVLVTKRNPDGSEKSVFDRYRNSGLFWYIRDSQNERLVWKADYPTQKDASSPDSYHHWWVERPVDMSILENRYFDCSIMMRTFRKEDLAKVKVLLDTPYPTGYRAAYEYLLKTVKGEIWETFYPFTSEWYPLYSAVAPRAGTFGTHYLDGREVEIYNDYNGTLLSMNINREGYKNPEKPEILSGGEIAAYTEQAKSRYCLAQWGLD